MPVGQRGGQPIATRRSITTTSDAPDAARTNVGDVVARRGRVNDGHRRWRIIVIPIDSPFSEIASFTILIFTRATRASCRNKRFADMVGNPLDQREMHARRQRAGRGMLEIEIILRRGQGRVGIEGARGQSRSTVKRYPQRLRQVRLLRIDAGEDRHFDIVHLEL